MNHDTMRIVYGEALHKVKNNEAAAERRRSPPKDVTIVKSIGGPSVTAGVFFDVLDAKSKQPTQP